METFQNICFDNAGINDDELILAQLIQSQYDNLVVTSPHNETNITKTPKEEEDKNKETTINNVNTIKEVSNGDTLKIELDILKANSNKGNETKKYTKRELYEMGYKILNKHQKAIFKECLIKQFGGLSLPMGSGKTLLALVLGLHQTKKNKLPILVVAAKSLIFSWAAEI